MNNVPRTMNTGPRTNRLSSLTCQSIMTSIMQNKPNLLDAQMNVTSILTRDYEKFIPLAGQKNKPNSNPIKPNFKRPQSQSCHSSLLVSYNCFMTELLIIGSSHDVKLTGAAHTASVFSRWLALSFDCLLFKNFHSFCLKVPVEAGHVKTLEEAK